MIRYLAIITLLIARPVRADEVADKLTVTGIAEFTAAYQAWDSARFVTAAKWFQQATTNTSATVTNFYWLGAAEFHHMLALQHGPGSATNKDRAAAALEAAVEALTAGVELDEKHAESRALLGTLYGLKINDSLLRAAWFGPKVMKNRDLALAAGPKNPRVRYLLGMCEFHTASKPAAWREALNSLLTAEKLFAEEAKRANSPLEPRWGHSSCLTFIGQTYELLGESAKAADYFRKALAEHPADHLAKAGLARVADQK
jgi:tetratricopeptide (TPR) repeat protein